MVNKVAGLARALAILLAIVAGFVALPVNAALVLLVLGLVAGLAYTADDFTRLALLVLALPVVGTALGAIPSIGTQLGAITGNLAIAVAGVLATRIAIRLYETVMGDLKGLAG